MASTGGQSPATETYCMYVDDSGDEHHDVLAAFCVPMRSWSGVIGYWKHFRRQMERQWGIPRGVEFHSVNVVARGSVSLPDPSAPDGAGFPLPMAVTMPDGQRVDRIDLYRLALTRIAEMNGGNRQFGVRLHVLRKQVPSGSGGLYEALIRVLEDWLDERGCWGIVWADGTDQGREAERRRVHRALDVRTRRVLEDATCRDSTRSHFLQMADACAYAAFKDVAAIRDKEDRKRLAASFDCLRELATVIDLDNE